MTVREIRDNELRLYVNSWGKTVKRKLIKTSGDNEVAACFCCLPRMGSNWVVKVYYRLGSKNC